MPKEPAEPTRRATPRKTTALRRKKVTTITTITPDDVATRAYFLHLEQPWADPQENWLRAEAELAV